MGQTSGFFVVSGKLDQAALSGALKGLKAVFQPSKTARNFDLLDCHDQSLRAKGQVLIASGGTLRLLQDDGPMAVQRCKGKGAFVHDLPDGPVRAALSDFPKLRALMGVGSGTVETSTFVVLDNLQKTQVRGSVLSLITAEGQVALVTVNPMRGYDRAFHTVCSTLRGMADGAAGIELVFASLLTDAVPYNAKPEVKLGKQEPSIEVATDIIHTFISVARQNEAGVIADIDTEFLHDYRVSLRRVRSVLSLFKGVFSPEQTAVLKGEFSSLMEPTGRVRDLDVYLLEKDIYFSLVPANLHQGLEAMFLEFAKERTRALARLSRWFRSADYNQKMNDLSALFADANGLEPGPNADRGAYNYACALIWKRYRKVCKLARSITPETSDEVVHDLRIDCKKLRYLMEFFSPLFDKSDFKKLIKPLKKLQDNLGLFNDYSVQQEALFEFVASQSNMQNHANPQLAMSVGGLIAVLDQRQKAERDRVIANFQHFDSPDIQHLFKTLFHQKED